MQIRLLTIQRYRGIQAFTWKPNAGINCLIGPGDTYKSTVLAAISLLLAPYPLGACSEFDYYRRRISDGFEIEAYIGNLDLPALGTEQRLPHFFRLAGQQPGTAARRRRRDCPALPCARKCRSRTCLRASGRWFRTTATVFGGPPPQGDAFEASRRGARC
jgi:hypothetical protein